LGQGIRGLRIGVVRHFFERDHKAGEDTLRAIDGALATLRDLGASVRDVKLSPLEDWHAAGLLIMLTEGYAVHEDQLKSRPERYGELFRDRIGMGAFIAGADYVAALRRRRELAAEMAQAMQEVDLLVSAAQPGEAPRIDAVPKWQMFEKPGFSMPFSISGFPAISICCGFGAKGLPLALQLAARPFEEAALLRAAHAYESATEWRRRRPGVQGRGATRRSTPGE
jgi:aspartyl-tRNA(Asn)/glutamyl-tRNA(Gln) amidotransferase subunit A